jgi:hypothetical protein
MAYVPVRLPIMMRPNVTLSVCHTATPIGTARLTIRDGRTRARPDLSHPLADLSHPLTREWRMVLM